MQGHVEIARELMGQALIRMQYAVAHLVLREFNKKAFEKA